MQQLLGSWIVGSFCVLGAFLLTACSSPEKTPPPQALVIPPEAAVRENPPAVLWRAKSRWVADIIRTYAAHDWPQDCLALAGRFADFPLKEDAPRTQPADVPRLIY